MTKLKGLSLFASAGISETYLDSLVDIKLANELIVKRAKLYSHFHKKSKMICGDVTKPDIYNKLIEESRNLKINFIMATPPCQSMSRAGKMSVNDERTLLFLPVLSMIEELQPRYVLIENVPEFLKAYYIVDGVEKEVMSVVRSRCSGYHIEAKILNSAHYETPQNRKRAIVLMSRNDLPIWKHPEPLNTLITTRDAIGHLPSLRNGEKSDIPHHNAKTHNVNQVRWMSHTPTGKSAHDNLVEYPSKDGRHIKGFKTTYKRINWNTPAPTITMMNGSISSQNNVHPGRLDTLTNTWSDARVLTILEIMLLTGLPSNWDIPDWASDTLIRHVIGEGVPPMLLYHVLKSLPN